MALKQSRYITADTDTRTDYAIRTTELDKVKDDPFVRRSEIQQSVNNSTLPVSARAVNLAIGSIDLSNYATIKYVDDAISNIEIEDVDLSEYRKLDNNEFNGVVQINCDDDGLGTGIFFFNKDETTFRANIVTNSAGMQFNQQFDGKLTSVLVPSDGGSGTIATREWIDGNSVGDGKIMREGAYGVGSTNYGFSQKIPSYSCFLAGNAATDGGLSLSGYSVVNLGYANATFCSRIAISVTSDRMFFNRGSVTSIVEKNWCELYHTSNTTVDSNGFIKSASPIIKLFDTRIEANDSFKEDPIFEKLDAGVYQIKNTLGLAKEGWYIEVPKDRNSDPLFNIEWSQDDDKTVTIRTYKRREMIDLIDDGKGNLLFGEKIIINGDPVDINDGRFVTLRFHEEIEEDGGI